MGTHGRRGRGARPVLAAAAVLALAAPALGHRPGGAPAPLRPPVAGPPLAAVGDAAPDYLENPGRTGSSPDDRVAPPLARVWTRTFDNQLTYPLIVGDRVFVGEVSSSAANPAASGDRVFALSLRTGRVLWKAVIPGPYYTVTLAYDSGRLFTVNWNGVVEAFSASTGRLEWQTKAPGDHYSDPPVAEGGTVYLASPTASRLNAINEHTGYFRWQVPAQTCGASIAVDSRRVYLDGCGEAAAYSRRTGASEWRRSRPGSSQITSATRFGSELSTNDGSSTSRGLSAGELVRATSGRSLGVYPYSFHPPAVAGGLLVLSPLDATHLSAIDTRGRPGRRRWSHSTRSQFGQPLVIGRDVFAMEGASLRVYDGLTGHGRGSAPVSPGPKRIRNQLPPAAMAAAEGFLVVPYESELSVYVSRYRPTSRGVEIGPSPPVLTYGAKQRVTIEGRLGSALRRHGSAQLELSAQAFSEGQRRVALGRSFGDGGLRFTVRAPRRNTVFAVTVGHGRAFSPPARVFVYPQTHYDFTYDRSTHKERATVTLRFDPGISLAGQMGYLYLNRVEQRTLFRLGRGRIRGSAGHGVLSVSFSPPRHTTPQDRILWCVHRLTRLGLGAPGRLDSQCGSAQISFR